MTDATAELRRTIYLLLGAAAVAICVAKIVGAENVVEPSRYDDPAVRKWPATRPAPTPMYSSNDKSRWATVRALVENGEYVVGRRENFEAKTAPFVDRGIVFEDGYQSLDKVMNPATGEFYSSKPPLFATLVAGEYWALNEAFGWTLAADRWPVVIAVLLTVNVLPFAVYLWLLARLIEQHGTTDFGRAFAFAVACFGTYLTTFSATLNNHTPAACCVLFAVYPLLRGRASPGGLFFSGFFAGFAATFELPALALVLGLFVPLLIVRPTRSLAFLAGALIPLAALAACNVASLGTLRPAYTEFGGPWYEYGGSHWLKLKDPVRPKGIDFNQEPTHVYAAHLLGGHHGWFSLTPAWLVGVVGIALSVKPGCTALRKVFVRDPGPVWNPPLLAGLTASITLVLLGFYLSRTQSYNYGGYTSGLRWLFWLTPLWLLVTLRGADAFAGYRRLRVLAAGLLGMSVLSVFYPSWNPWRFPWLQQLGEYYGWVRY